MREAFLVATVTLSAVVLVLAFAAFVYGFLRPDRATSLRRRPPRFPQYRPVRPDQVAILIACRNGAATIGSAVTAARATGVPVYVVSDASSDATGAVASAAGAQVLELTQNVGKPAALHAAYAHFGLGSAYRAVAILDDDVLVEPDFVTAALAELGAEVAIVVGHNVTWWPPERRWNPWLAKRAYSYWNYQAVVRRLQSHFNVMNCISGSNSIYRTELLDVLLPQQPPYIVDDTYWVLETHRRQLGKVVYAPRAVALLQDPTTCRDWYRQNLRWLWGTFQGVIGHRVGRRNSRFDQAYLLLMLHWVLYVAGAPLTLWLLATAGPGLGAGLLFLLAGQGLWVGLAAWRLRRPRLVLFLPTIILADLLYRVIFVHALVRAIRQPTVDRCVWASPERIAVPDASATAAPDAPPVPAAAPVAVPDAPPVPAATPVPVALSSASSTTRPAADTAGLVVPAGSHAPRR
ncbi:glycosyltransferase family 2 protein [Micromonospora cathayae]|uniref:Glycosyltransferase n=1 Tax=Micromonospora cathayae TaxID=3028804 RepID=A0ABY7ZR91_9ACTN|nr:glycosyltransferase [Micromonospora sp. HUAS 3]WDZ85549.1 glycosyltransferase [Micromonospora sp. HUAS 3]